MYCIPEGGLGSNQGLSKNAEESNAALLSLVEEALKNPKKLLINCTITFDETHPASLQKIKDDLTNPFPPESYDHSSSRLFLNPDGKYTFTIEKLPTLIK